MMFEILLVYGKTELEIMKDGIIEAKFLGKEMTINEFARCYFHFEDELTKNTLPCRRKNDLINTSEIYIIQSRYILKEIQNIDLNQENPISKYFVSNYLVHVSACYATLNDNNVGTSIDIKCLENDNNESSTN
ncbi:hypothetical protein PCK1_002254 [Pneumocystis canis]|nr:hypothetical protein PCK1_002254 [Pneumocystis canis]